MHADAVTHFYYKTYIDDVLAPGKVIVSSCINDIMILYIRCGLIDLLMPYCISLILS